MIVKFVEDLYSLRGDFAFPQGGVEKTEDGYRYVGDHITVTTKICHDEGGINLRTDCIKNTSDHDVDVREALSKFVFHGGEYEVYSQYSEWTFESIGQWQPLLSEVSGGNDDVRMNANNNPFVAIYNTQNGHGTAFHILADSTWRYRVKKYYKQTEPRVLQIHVELGINDRDFCKKLAPGEELTLPTILYYDFTEKRDMEAYRLHRWCNKTYPARSMPVIYNSWLARADMISYDFLADQLAVAKRIGVDYFVVDAGWFGPPKEWYGSVGDWVESEKSGLAGRMGELADLVRAEGLKFGLWFEIERASLNSKAYQNNSQYYITEGNNAFIDFSNPAACDYIFDAIATQIRKYGIEFIKFDFNAPITYDRNRHAFLDYYKGYRGVIERLGREFPTLYLENCASGGLRMALTNLRGFDSFWVSDNHSMYEELEIYKNTILRMPCRAIEKWITIQSHQIQGKAYECILMSGDAGFRHVDSLTESFLRAAAIGGPIGISCDLTALSDWLIEILRDHVAQYKAERDFWINAECHILADTPTVLALQYTDKRYDEIKVYTYVKRAHQNGIILYPACDEGAVYVDGEGNRLCGADLARDGVEILFENKYVVNAYPCSFKKV